MRKLMWFTVGFAAAAAVGAYLYSGKYLMILAVLFVLPMTVLLFCKNMTCKLVATVLIGFVSGLFCYSIFDNITLSNIRSYDGTEQWISFEATDYAFQTEYGYGVDGMIEKQGKTYAVRLYYDQADSVKPGDCLQGAAKLRYTPAGGKQPSTYHKGEGVFLLAYARDTMDYTAATAIPSKYFAAQLRENISHRISEIFPEDTAAFSKALLLGDDSEISYRENMSFQKSGIRHIIAVSGLHVSILFSMVYFVTYGRSGLTLLIGLPVLLLFSAVAGFTPSVVRACIMQALMILSMAVSREYDRATSLSFAVLVILVANPLAITSVSFQLSVGSMIGIFLFSQKIAQYLLDRKPFKKLDRKSKQGRFLCSIVQSFGVTLGAMTVTVPLCACYFGMVSVIGAVTNLLTLWIVSYVFCGIIVACLLSMLWMPLGVLLAAIISWLIRYILFAAQLLSCFPGGVAYTDSPYTVLWITSTLSLLILFAFSKRRSPALLAGAISFLYVLSLFATWVEPYTDDVRMTILDVGQGQCVLLQSKDSAYLLDCGGDDPERTADAAVEALGAQGIYSLDGIILTHYDTDHANGTPYLLQAVPVERLYLPAAEPESKLRKQLESQDVPITWVTDRKMLPCGVGELTIYPFPGAEDGNESSMCILYQGENCAILITGDRDLQGESYLLQQGDIPKLDVLVVGHHGASTAAGWELLAHTQPDVAVISVGENNFHDHPDAYTLERLHRFGCIVRRTDKEGTITIRG